MTTTKPKIEQTNDGLFVVRLLQVPVNWGLTFEEAIRLGAPNTSGDYFSWHWQEEEAGQHPKPAGKSGIKLTDISLLGFGRNWESQKGINYAAAKNLPTAAFQQVLAIGEAFPRLNRDLGKDFLEAVSLQRCSLDKYAHLPYLWFREDERRADASRFGLGWSVHGWFAVLGEVS